jgi:hypothetical protein
LVREILAAIGADGMGEVYRPRDTKLDREVALKSSAEGVYPGPRSRDAGTVKILDFGLANALMPDPSENAAMFSPTFERRRRQRCSAPA